MLTHAPLQGRKILVVEDNFLVADHLSRVLREAGWTVLGPAPNAEWALPLARQDDLSGAVLDVRVAGGTSLAIAVELNARRVPYLVVTGYDPRGIPREMGNAPFMSKPIDAQVLVRLAQQAFAT